MPTKKPRIHVVLEQPLFQKLKSLSAKEGLSMSLEAREIIRAALNSPDKRHMRTYTGKHINDLIGKYKMGRSEPEDIFADQVHG